MRDYDKIMNDLQHGLQKQETVDGFLNHYIDWLTEQIGDCNIGIWLMGEEGVPELSCYRQSTNRLSRDLRVYFEDHIFPEMDNRNFDLYENRAWLSPLLSSERTYCFLAMKCLNDSKAFAMIVLFRPVSAPIAPLDEATTNLVEKSEMFFVNGLTIVIEAKNKLTNGDCEAEEGSRGGRDPADWWKYGSKAPY